VRSLGVASDLVALATALAPLAFILVVSFSEYHALGGGDGLIAEWLDDRNVNAMGNSLAVGFGVAVLLTVISILAALCFRWCNLTGHSTIYMLSILPLTVPDYVFGVAGRVMFDPSVDEALRRTQDMLDRLGVGAGVWQRRPENLSGGETQRVALAEALLKPSRVLLLDEPMSNVDKSRKGEFGALVRDLAREKGLVVLYISHDEWELFLTADRLAITEDGQMLQVGHYQEISGAPVSGKVAAIGSAVGLQTLTRAELETLGNASHFAEPFRSNYALVGWRPEAGRLHSTPSHRNAELVLNMRAERLLRIGSSVFVNFTAVVGGSKRWFWHVINPRPVDVVAVEVGTPMQFTLEKGDLLFMDTRGTILRPTVNIECGDTAR